MLSNVANWVIQKSEQPTSLQQTGQRRGLVRRTGKRRRMPSPSRRVVVVGRVVKSMELTHACHQPVAVGKDQDGRVDCS